MNTFPEIVEILKFNNTPCWTLYIVEGSFNKNRVGQNMTAPKKDAPEEEKIDDATMTQSLAMLEQQVEIYGRMPGVVLAIEYSKTPKSLKMGPVKFTRDGSPAAQPAQPGYGGLSGMTPEFLDKRLEIERERNKIDLERNNFLHECQRKTEELDRRKAALDEFEKSLKEKEKIYEKESERVKLGISKVWDNIKDDIIPGTKKETSLQGAAEVKPEPSTPQDEVIESIALNIQTNVKDIEEIKRIGAVVHKCIEQPAIINHCLTYKPNGISEQVEQ